MYYIQYYILLKTQNEIIFTLVTLKMLLYKKKKSCLFMNFLNTYVFLKRFIDI